MKRYCANCGTLFETSIPSQRFCGSVCTKASVPKGHFIILERDHFQCVYCGRSAVLDHAQMTVDHILPVTAGGDDRAINLVACCRTCNNQKTNRIFKEKLQRQLFAAIHDRNVATGIEDNQRIDLGSTSALARHDLENMSVPELQRIVDQMGTSKEDARKGFLALLQITRITTLQIRKLAADLDEPDVDLMKSSDESYERFGLIMAQIENDFYRLDDPAPKYTIPLFDLYNFVGMNATVLTYDQPWEATWDEIGKSGR